MTRNTMIDLLHIRNLLQSLNESKQIYIRTVITQLFKFYDC